MGNIDMGLGTKLPVATFVMKFRWTLASRDLPPDFMKAVSFDYCNKLITFSYYQVSDSHVHSWVDNLAPDDELTFSTYDGCGKPMTQAVFRNLVVVGQKEDFDYSTSDVAFTTVIVKYNDIEREVFSLPPRGSSYNSNFQVDSIDEIYIDHLNAKMFVPGKAVLKSV